MRSHYDPEHIDISSGELAEFVDALLGKPNLGTEREELDWLAAVSPESVRRLRATEPQSGEDSAAKELDEFVRAIQGGDEVAWDPNKHPRTGSPPNRGYWAPTGGPGAGNERSGGQTPALNAADHHGVNATFASQKSDDSKTPRQGGPAKEPAGAIVDNVHHHGGTPEQHERFRKLLDELAEDDETLAGSLARAAKNKNQIHVHWIDGSTHSTRGGPGGTKSHEPLGIHLDKNHPNYVANPKEVEFDDVDPDKAAKIVIGHELGHTVADLEDPTDQNPRGGNVTLVENPLRKRLGVKQRQKYNGRDVPSRLDSKDKDFQKAKAHQEEERRNERRRRLST